MTGPTDMKRSRDEFGGLSRNDGAQERKRVQQRGEEGLAR